MDQLMIFILTELASVPGFVIVCLLIGFGFLLKSQTAKAGIFFGTTLGLMVSTTLLKVLFQVPRPLNGLVEVTSYAFPSGHAVGVMYLGLIVCYLSRQLPVIPRYAVYGTSAIGIITIGASRIALGVHTPLQVIAGFALGALWVWVCVYFFSKLKNN